MRCCKCGKELVGATSYYAKKWECSVCNVEDVIHSERGTKLVVDTFNAGYESERKEAERLLAMDIVYTVEEIEVGSWHTDIVLKEFPDEKFNSVFFRRE